MWFLFIFCFYSSGLRAELISEGPIPTYHYGDTNNSIVPNERNPGDAEALFARSNGGIYVSVGTERGFIGAAQSKSSRLVLVDSDPSVVLFNRINTMLLKLAKDLPDYRELRLDADFESWKQRIHALTKNDPARALLETPEVWLWWQHFVRNQDSQRNRLHKNRVSFAELHQTQIPGRGDAFEGTSYLHDPSQFQHLQNLAKSGKIESHVLDLRKEKGVRDFVSSIRRAAPKESLGVLDLSNCWDRKHLEVEGVAKVTSIFESLARPDSLVLLTGENHAYNRVWSYNGFSYDYLSREKEKLGSLRAVFQHHFNEDKDAPPSSGPLCRMFLLAE